ncbi:MAG: 50S ribosomal protein L15 [Candidatus Omnitrophota bacterium]
MKLNEIGIPYGARRKKKRVGRGSGSGHGKTSTRGHKGLKARSGAGGKLRLSFEGGQMPLIRRVPKRGFTSPFKVISQVINIEQLNHFRKDETVDLKKLRESNLIKTLNKPVKILGNGELKKALTVYAHSFSKSAIDKIAKAGGKAERLPVSAAGPKKPKTEKK